MPMLGVLPKAHAAGDLTNRVMTGDARLAEELASAALKVSMSQHEAVGACCGWGAQHAWFASVMH